MALQHKSSVGRWVGAEHRTHKLATGAQGPASVLEGLVFSWCESHGLVLRKTELRLSLGLLCMCVCAHTCAGLGAQLRGEPQPPVTPGRFSCGGRDKCGIWNCKIEAKSWSPYFLGSSSPRQRALVFQAPFSHVCSVAGNSTEPVGWIGT